MAKSQFAAQFDRSFSIHEAINAAVSPSAAGPALIDPLEVVQQLLRTHPEIGLPPSELAQVVARAAADAGVRLSRRPQMP